MIKLKFDSFDLSKETQHSIFDMGYEEASAIQTKAIPVILEGKDIIGQAQTGTGKTAAFAIPVIEKIVEDDKSVQAIVLCPTRELVIQVSEEFRKLSKYKDKVKMAPVYGGQNIERQLRLLEKGPQIIIGTPGRTMDHIKRGTLKCDNISMVVLDEADEMLDMGFREDIEFILKHIPEKRQTIMFSATMAKDILEISKNYLKNPEIINVIPEKKESLQINQSYFEVAEKNKPELLARLLDLNNVKLALVFCNTKSKVDELVEVLKTRGYFADGLHGDMNQAQRDKVMRGFRTGSVEILVATDVAGRGIDVNDVEAVFNFDMPRDDEDYTHRIGRTGRAGKSGNAFTFITGKQIHNLKKIERMNGVKIQKSDIPTVDDVEDILLNSYMKEVMQCIDEGDMGKYQNFVSSLTNDECCAEDIAAGLFKIIIKKQMESFDSQADMSMPKEEKRDSKKKFFSKGKGGAPGKNKRGFEFSKNNGKSDFRKTKSADSKGRNFKSRKSSKSK